MLLSINSLFGEMMIRDKNIIIVGASSIISKFRSPSTNIIASYFTKKDIKPENTIHPVKLE